jgi:hypothetical protein
VRLLLDEHLSPLVAELLRDRGHDVVAIKRDRPDVEGSSDHEVMEVAHRERRAVVTNNVKDFRPIAAARIVSGHGHGGLVLVPASVPRTRAAVGHVVAGLESILRAEPDGIAGRERWIAPPTT